MWVNLRKIGEIEGIYLTNQFMAYILSGLIKLEYKEKLIVQTNCAN